MKKEEISGIISRIDEKYIEEAVEVKRKKSPVIRYVSIAACLVVAVSAGIFISQSGIFNMNPTELGNKLQNGYPVAGEGEVGKNTPESGETVTNPAIYTEEIATVLRWEDITNARRYGELKTGDMTYSTMDCELSADKADEFLCDCEMTGYDIYTDKTYTTKAQVYSIKNISEKCAVAVKFQDEDKYYVYTNFYYSPDSLGEMINDLNLRETLSFGIAYYGYEDTDADAYVTRVYADFDDSIVWNMLLSDEGVKNTPFDGFYESGVDISISIPLLGFENISFDVTAEGYIVTNIMHTRKCFFVGKEKTEAFCEYLSENVKYKENTVVREPSYDIAPGKGENEMVTPGYDPQAPNSYPPVSPSRSEVILPDDVVEAVTT